MARLCENELSSHVGRRWCWCCLCEAIGTTAGPAASRRTKGKGTLRSRDGEFTLAPTQQEFSTTPKWLIGSIGLQFWICPTNPNPKVCPSLFYLLLWELERCSDLSRFLRLLRLFLSASILIYPHVSNLCVIRPLFILAYLNPLPPPSCPRMTSVRESAVVLLSYLVSLLVLGCICMNSDLNSDLFTCLDLEIKVWNPHSICIVLIGVLAACLVSNRTNNKKVNSAQTWSLEECWDASSSFQDLHSVLCVQKLKLLEAFNWADSVLWSICSPHALLHSSYRVSATGKIVA